jgi:hypothetical protein
MRNEQHCCSQCKKLYEVWQPADPVDTDEHVDVQVKCPWCRATHTLNVPRGAEKHVRVEKLAGLPPETGALD